MISMFSRVTQASSSKQVSVFNRETGTKSLIHFPCFISSSAAPTKLVSLLFQLTTIGAIQLVSAGNKNGTRGNKVFQGVIGSGRGDEEKHGDGAGGRK